MTKVTLIASTVLAVSAALTQAQGAKTEIASGVVYHDRNANGARDWGDPGLANIKVSNGQDVVMTDDKGRFAIPVDDDDIVFVIKPRGFRTTLDELNLPRFYYIHKPNGSPDADFNYKGVAPTGPLPHAIEFPLVKQEEPERFEVVLIGDPQPYSQQEALWYAQDNIAELAANSNAAFGVSLGDLVGDRLELFDDINRAQSLVGVPWYNVYGNHDMNFKSPSDEHADETFERVYGPANYAFQYASVHFIVLDNVYWKGYAGDRESGFPITNNYKGALRPDQLEFVRNFVSTVPNDELIVLLFHIPIEGNDVHRIPEQRELFEILSSHPRTLSFSGHTHLQRHWFFTSEHGYTGGAFHHHLNAATGSGSWYRGASDVRGLPHTTMRCGAPNGYTIATFEGQNYSTRFKAASMSPDHQIRIWTPDLITTETLDEAEVVANVFAGSERSRVWVQVNNGPWYTMDHTVRQDPHLAAIKALEESDTPPNGRPIPGLGDSHHLWATKLPDDLQPGYHHIRVRTVDMYGQNAEASSIIRVDQAP